MTSDGRPKVMELVRDNTVVPLTVVGVSEQTLEKVLERLQKNDELFDYNVPSEMRNPSREGLQEFLVRVYLQRDFEIIGEEAVKKYLRVYDFVGFNGADPSFEYNIYLKPGMKGVIRKVELWKDFPLTILLEKCAEFPKEQNVENTGGGISILPNGPFQRQKISSKIEVLAAAAPGRLVEFESTDIQYCYYLPVGTKGIVTKVDRSKELPVEVVFGNTEGYIPPENGRIYCKFSGLKLFRENRIDIRKLIRELL